MDRQSSPTRLKSERIQGAQPATDPTALPTIPDGIARPSLITPGWDFTTANGTLSRTFRFTSSRAAAAFARDSRHLAAQKGLEARVSEDEEHRVRVELPPAEGATVQKLQLAQAIERLFG